MNALRTRTNWLVRATYLRALVLLILVVIGMLIAEPTTLTSYGVTFNRIVDTCMVAVGLTPVLILGEIDLSVGATMAVSGAVAAQVSSDLTLGIICGLLTGIAIGLVNAALVLVVRVNSFIATLATMIALNGLVLQITSNQPVPLKDVGAAISFSTDLVGQITPGVLIVAGLSLVVLAVMALTRFGRAVYAVGGNDDAAVAANIHTARTRAAGFVICAVCASAAGLIDTINQSSASPTTGQSVLLLAIAGAVIGGAQLSGGRGSIFGSILGSLALGAISVALELHNINSNLEDVVVGFILFVAVVVNRQAIGGLRLDVAGRQLRRMAGG